MSINMSADYHKQASSTKDLRAAQTSDFASLFVIVCANVDANFDKLLDFVQYG